MLLSRISHSTLLDPDLKAKGGYNQLMIRLKIGRSKHMGIQHRRTKTVVDENIIYHVTRMRMVSIAIPHSLMEKLVLKPSVGHKELVGCAEIKEPLAISILLTKAMQTNDSFP